MQATKEKIPRRYIAQYFLSVTLETEYNSESPIELTQVVNALIFHSSSG